MLMDVPDLEVEPCTTTQDLGHLPWSSLAWKFQDSDNVNQRILKLRFQYCFNLKICKLMTPDYKCNRE